MDYEEAFVREIRVNPADDMPRLIYADFLEEQGQPQGEFIRVQCELAGLGPLDPRRLELIEREQQLLDQHAEEWLEPLRNLGVKGLTRTSFHKGLIEHVKIEAAEFVSNSDALCELAPAVSAVQLVRVKESLKDLCGMTLPEQIRMLDFSANKLNPDDAAALAKAGWTSQLEGLNLQLNALGSEGARNLGRGNWQRLHYLALGSNRIGGKNKADRIGALVESTWVQNLRRLFLNVNQLENANCKELAEAKNLSGLQVLDLASNSIQAAGVKALGESLELTSLESLNLRGNPAKAPGYQPFASGDCPLRKLKAFAFTERYSSYSETRVAPIYELLPQKYPAPVVLPGFPMTLDNPHT